MKFLRQIHIELNNFHKRQGFRPAASENSDEHEAKRDADHQQVMRDVAYKETQETRYPVFIGY